MPTIYDVWLTTAMPNAPMATSAKTTAQLITA
jgi:hypothetical protein